MPDYITNVNGRYLTSNGTIEIDAPTPMNVTTEIKKRAWIAEPGYPIGKRAPGRIDCPCGRAPLSNFGDGNDVHCPCGIVYDSEGWILYRDNPPRTA